MEALPKADDLAEPQSTPPGVRGEQTGNPTSDVTAGPDDQRLTTGVSLPLSNGPPQYIDIYFKYELYALVRIEGKEALSYNCIESPRDVRPLHLRVDDLSLESLKAAFISRLRHMSKKWPLDFVAFRAEQGSILSWKYGTTEAHPLYVNDWQLAELRTQTMPDFVETAVNTWRPQVVWLSVSMPKHAKKTHPASVVTLMPPIGHGSAVVVHTPVGPIHSVEVPPSLLWGDVTQDRPSGICSCPPGPTRTWTMGHFLSYCRFPTDDHHILQMVKRHAITDWTAFKNISRRELWGLGFKWGTAQLIHNAVESIYGPSG